MKNRYKVQASQWKKWNPQAQFVFNNVYEIVLSNQELMLHPKAKKATSEHWKTTAWNVAWTAANAVKESHSALKLPEAA